MRHLWILCPDVKGHKIHVLPKPLRVLYHGEPWNTVMLRCRAQFSMACSYSSLKKFQAKEIMEMPMFNMNKSSTYTDIWRFNITSVHKWNDVLDHCLVHMENFSLKINNVLHLREEKHILYHVTLSIHSNLKHVDLISQLAFQKKTVIYLLFRTRLFCTKLSNSIFRENWKHNIKLEKQKSYCFNMYSNIRKHLSISV